MSPTEARHRAVIFDLDGVLLDTEPLYSRATREVLAPFGVSFELEHKRAVMGLPRQQSAQVLLELSRAPLTIEEFLTARDRALSALLPTCPAMPGAESWVGALSAAGVPVAIATSSSRAALEVKRARHPWLGALSPALCSDDAEVVRGKPAPDIYLAAAARLGVDPARCVAFEDSPAGVQAALAAGTTVVHLRSDFVRDEDVPFAHHRLAGLAEASIARLSLGA